MSLESHPQRQIVTQLVVPKHYLQLPRLSQTTSLSFDMTHRESRNNTNVRINKEQCENFAMASKLEWWNSMLKDIGSGKDTALVRFN